MKKVIICLFTFALVMTGCVSTTSKKTNSESKVIEIGVCLLYTSDAADEL